MLLSACHAARSGQQVAGLPVGLHPQELGGRGALRVRRLVVGDLHAGVGEDLAQLLERRAGHADGHRRDDRPGVVERLHDAGKTLLHVDLRVAEQVVLRDAEVVEADHRGVGRLDAELVLEPVDPQARVLTRDDERLDRGAAE